MDPKVKNIRYKPSDIQPPQLTHKASLISPYNPEEEMVLESHTTSRIIRPLTNSNSNSNSSNSNTSAIKKLKQLFGL
jgi:hypothetical protein